ncbi:hypothetical protein GA0004736_3377 [Curtobacterium sp. 9128]|uniref:hypothetical protein n=1 Tax=Curtobacterium sp. 9128 TaxID=1793722 RepID=UPI0007D73387|nr:hypothetical protein [Curtobacterium sp. 9128]SBN64417.1 hypothetical protein GA0004736_3377 [Curtobacterium sp. 9128]
MRAALILMGLAMVLAVVKAAVGAPTIDGVTFLVFVLVIASLAAYYRWSVAPRRNR